MALPKFTYHPDPLGTRALVASAEVCDCCGQARGYKYNATIYARKRARCICPWCISDGTAARKLDGKFVDDDPLKSAGVPQSVIDDVCLRTPGYSSWQQEVWQAHCGDACEFHGDATEVEVADLAGEALSEFLRRSGLKREHWPRLRDNYVPGGDASIFKFVCRKCGFPVYNLDLS